MPRDCISQAEAGVRNLLISGARLACHAKSSEKAVAVYDGNVYPSAELAREQNGDVNNASLATTSIKDCDCDTFSGHGDGAIVAFGSKFSDCKSSALTRYSAAVLEANPENAKRAIIESTACDRFIFELPKDEQEKIKGFQEEMQRFQLDQSRIQNKT